MEEEEISLLTIIKELFNDEGLRDICYHIFVEYEDLPAVGRAGKARELILLCERDGQLPSLIAYLNQLRPDIPWPSTARPLTQAQLIGKVEEKLLVFEPETIEIPAGAFIMGCKAGESKGVYETPAHEVYLEQYWVGKCPVTNFQYERFVRETERPVAPEIGWAGRIHIGSVKIWSLSSISFWMPLKRLVGNATGVY